MLKLYSYWRSSAAYRVRIVLNLKALPHEIVPVPLTSKDNSPLLLELKQLNAASCVPVLIDGERVLTQSLAIIEYLEDTYPEPSLLPKDHGDKAYVRALCQDITSDIHPLNNLKVLRYLLKEMEVSKVKKDQWIKHWLNNGFYHLEHKLTQTDISSNLFLTGNQPSLFEACLIPQVRNALAVNLDLTLYPIIHKIYENAMQLMAFKEASWEQQMDYIK
ncbi:MAG: maleylacetoacetate isomerase [Ferrovum sp. 37-45-19]|uniref:maleylacetoacetate isomerase n=1 Tax=Ferrovum sp. JA12 TaxID=1356299 RepID=UPI0007026203|nr:maleylacetoacetate isomerase [Ferrovum sp. JA12]KRH79941.1 maleylpyruvate isomerase [Ferrovum sp. JA12]OYV93493.1 MAG: maleylacetoacetate isomerase [Ferrovum sp. 37-45-19]OZB33120.1 MAG: maleylacetoacetate isomerase [Ferrovum sp. 34-44-207]HQT82208.1 maleylacetoacetate isomerase [Ferrovaceae bacterium]